MVLRCEWKWFLKSMLSHSIGRVALMSEVESKE